MTVSPFDRTAQAQAMRAGCVTGWPRLAPLAEDADAALLDLRALVGSPRTPGPLFQPAVPFLYRVRQAGRQSISLTKLAGIEPEFMLNDVYNRRILELAGTIPRIGRLEAPDASATRSEERRVGKECRSRWCEWCA